MTATGVGRFDRRSAGTSISGIIIIISIHTTCPLSNPLGHRPYAQQILASRNLERVTSRAVITSGSQLGRGGGSMFSQILISHCLVCIISSVHVLCIWGSTCIGVKACNAKYMPRPLIKLSDLRILLYRQRHYIYQYYTTQRKRPLIPTRIEISEIAVINHFNVFFGENSSLYINR